MEGTDFKIRKNKKKIRVFYFMFLFSFLIKENKNTIEKLSESNFKPRYFFLKISNSIKRLQNFIFLLVLQFVFSPEYTNLKSTQRKEKEEKERTLSQKKKKEVSLFDYLKEEFKFHDEESFHVNHFEESFPFAKNMHLDNNNQMTFGIIDKENIKDEQKSSLNIWMSILTHNLKKITNKEVNFGDFGDHNDSDVNKIILCLN